jgi:hypothetical protein
MQDFEAAASRLFPSMGGTPTAAPPAQPVAAPNQPQATADAGGQQAAAPGVPQPGVQQPATPAARPADGGKHLDPDMQALREDAGERMFTRPEAERAVPDNLFDEVVGQTVEVDGHQIQLSEEFAREAVVGLRVMAADLALSSADVATVGEALEFAQSIHGDEQKTLAARESAVELLNAQYGDEAMLAARAARAYVAKNPKLGELLDRTGAGDAPQVIALIARRAVALHKAGKLNLGAAPRAAQQSPNPKPAQGTSLQGTSLQRLYASSGMNP